MRVKLPLDWQHPGEARAEEKTRALVELGLLCREANDEDIPSVPDSTSAAVVLDLDSEDVAQASRAVVDALQVLVLTDLELYFWPPPPALEVEARAALASLRPASLRRALLSARRVLLAATAAATPARSAEEVAVLREVLGHVAAECNALCGADGPAGPATAGTMRLLPAMEHLGLHADPALRVCDFVGRGRGIVLAEPIDAGREVLVIPESCLLNVFTALTSPSFGRAAHALLTDGLHAETVAMLFAIAERRRCSKAEATRASAVGAGSSLAPWAELLTEAPSLEEEQQLLAWPTEAVEALGAEQIQEVLQNSLASLWKLSRQVVVSLQSLPEEEANSLGGAVGFDDLLWARCLFDSRAVAAEVTMPPELCRAASSPLEPPTVDGFQWLALRDAEGVHKTWALCPKRIVCLAPCMELLNHSARGACLSPVFDAERRVLVVATAAALSTGAELCLSYGALQNWEFMMYYGFCPEANPHDRLTLSMAPPEDNDGTEDGTLREVMLRLREVPTDHALRPPDPNTTILKTMPSCDGSSGWARLGLLPPQLLRCLRLLLAEDAGAVDVDAPPGRAGDELLDLDLRCLATAEEVLVGLQAHFEPLPSEDRPVWWPLYGSSVMKFRASQHALVTANLAAVTAARQSLEVPMR